MAKLPQAWVSDDGSATVTTSNQGVQRLEENSVVRTTESGVTRVLEDLVITPKIPTVWTEA